LPRVKRGKIFPRKIMGAQARGPFPASPPGGLAGFSLKNCPTGLVPPLRPAQRNWPAFLGLLETTVWGFERQLVPGQGFARGPQVGLAPGFFFYTAPRAVVPPRDLDFPARAPGNQRSQKIQVCRKPAPCRGGPWAGTGPGPRGFPLGSKNPWKLRTPKPAFFRLSPPPPGHFWEAGCRSTKTDLGKIAPAPRRRGVKARQKLGFLFSKVPPPGLAFFPSRDFLINSKAPIFPPPKAGLLAGQKSQATGPPKL